MDPDTKSPDSTQEATLPVGRSVALDRLASVSTDSDAPATGLASDPDPDTAIPVRVAAEATSGGTSDSDNAAVSTPAAPIPNPPAREVVLSAVPRPTDPTSSQGRSSGTEAVDTDTIPIRHGPPAFAGPGAAASVQPAPDADPGAVSTDVGIASDKGSEGSEDLFTGSTKPKESVVFLPGQAPPASSGVLDQVPLDQPNAGNEPKPPVRLLSRQRLVGLSLLGVGLIAAALLGVKVELNKTKTQEASESLSSRLQQQVVPLGSLNKQLGTITPASSAVTVNGQLQVTNSLVLQPSTLTGPAVTGEMYYDSATNRLAYYNGTGFVSLQGGGSTSVTNVTNTYVTDVTNGSSAGASAGAVTGSGTAGTLALFTSSNTLGNSLVSESGSTVDAAAALRLQGTTDSTTALQVENATGNTTLLNVDTTDSEISFGTGAGSALGYTGIGQHNGGGAGHDVMTAQKVVTTAGGTITSMSVYVGGWGIEDAPTNNYQFAIYADNGSGTSPGAYIASSAVGELGTSTTWYTLPINATLAPNTTYWLAYWQNDTGADSDNSYSVNYPVSGALNVSAGSVAWQSGPDNGFPATFPALTASYSNLASLYATYASSSPAMTINQYGTLAENGAATFQDPTDSTGALQVNDSLGNAALDVSTASDSVGIGTSDPSGGQLDVVGSTAEGLQNAEEITGATSDNTTNALTIDNSSGTTIGQFTDNGNVELGTGAGSALGYTTIGPNVDGWGDNTMNAQRFTTTGGGAVTSMSAYVGTDGFGPSPYNQYQFAIYADNGSGTAPGAYLASSAVGTFGGSAGWYSLPITATLSANTTYWLVYWQNMDAQDQALNGVSSNEHVSNAVSGWICWPWQSGSDNGLPATFPTSGGIAGCGTNFSMNATTLMTLYATYASSSPALTLNSSGTLTQDGAALFQDPTDSVQALQVDDSLGDVLLAADTADMQITIGGNLIVTGAITVDGHIVTGGGTPAITADSAAACGGTATATISGDDTAGTITVTTGVGGSCSAGDLATVTFNSAFGATPRVTLTPESASSESLLPYVDGSSLSSSGFAVGSIDAATPSATYTWDYWVAQ